MRARRCVSGARQIVIWCHRSNKKHGHFQQIIMAELSVFLLVSQQRFLTPLATQCWGGTHGRQCCKHDGARYLCIGLRPFQWLVFVAWCVFINFKHIGDAISLIHSVTNLIFKQKHRTFGSLMSSCLVCRTDRCITAGCAEPCDKTGGATSSAGEPQLVPCQRHLDHWHCHDSRC